MNSPFYMFYYILIQGQCFIICTESLCINHVYFISAAEMKRVEEVRWKRAHEEARGMLRAYTVSLNSLNQSVRVNRFTSLAKTFMFPYGYCLQLCYGTFETLLSTNFSRV